MEWLSGSELGKEYVKTAYCHLAYLTYNAEYIMGNARLNESQAEIKIARRNINNIRYVDDTTLMAESKKELKHFLIRVKEEIGKAGLKPSNQKTEIMSSDPITSWQIDGGKMETVTDFIFLGPKSLWTVTAAMNLKDVCSLEEKL